MESQYSLKWVTRSSPSVSRTRNAWAHARSAVTFFEGSESGARTASSSLRTWVISPLSSLSRVIVIGPIFVSATPNPRSKSGRSLLSLNRNRYFPRLSLARTRSVAVISEIHALFLRLGKLVAPLQNLEQKVFIFVSPFAEQHLQIFDRGGVDGKVAIELIDRADRLHEALPQQRFLGQPVAHSGEWADRHGAVS